MNKEEGQMQGEDKQGDEEAEDAVTKKRSDGHAIPEEEIEAEEKKPEEPIESPQKKPSDTIPELTQPQEEEEKHECIESVTIFKIDAINSTAFII